MDEKPEQPRRVAAPATIDKRGMLLMTCPGCQTEYGLCGGVYSIYCVRCEQFLDPNFKPTETTA